MGLSGRTKSKTRLDGIFASVIERGRRAAVQRGAVSSRESDATVSVCRLCQCSRAGLAANCSHSDEPRELPAFASDGRAVGLRD
jgi:hypothetical protein